MNTAGDDAVTDTAHGDAVLYEVSATGVAMLTLNRPERLNTWGGDIATVFYASLHRAEDNPAVRVIVLTGRGKAFCAGAQLSSMGTVAQSSEKTDQRDLTELVGERHPYYLTTLRKPVIAAINGSCVGIGLTQALMCDVRFAAAGAKFAASFARRGLVAEYGISWILPRLTSWGVALDLLLSGRTFLADEAVGLGLVKEVVAPEQLMKWAVDYAEDIARHCSPASMAVIKRQVFGDATRQVAETSSRAEILLQESLLRPDVLEGITSFLEKQAPSFPGMSASTWPQTTLAAPERMIMGNLSYKAIDVDNHYYEPLDAFTRYLDKKFRRRGVQMVSDGKHTQTIIGDRINRFIPNPTFDPIIVPGCLDLLFRGEIPEGVDPASLMKVERLGEHPEYQNRAARIAVMDTQCMETVFMLPTFACGVEEALTHDVDATMASLHAFNLWLDEDWGFDRPDHRIIAAPIISLADPTKALEEVEFVLGHSAKLVLVRPAPVPGVVRPRSLGDPAHDPVWAALAEAGVPVGFHLSDSGYLQVAAMWGGRSTFEAFGGSNPLDQILVDDRAIHDTMASMIVHGVFTRHPRLKAVSIENGSYFVYRLIKRLKKAANNHPRLFPEDPVEQLRNNVWIAPYYEDGLPSLASVIGVDKVLFGSDWPHGEGLENPVSFTEELTGFSDDDVRKIMRDNALDLLGVTVASAA